MVKSISHSDHRKFYSKSILEITAKEAYELVEWNPKELLRNFSAMKKILTEIEKR